ncbi:hypothetical protein SPYSS1447_0451 [Streptococcus pyogenes SS1447]|nr:hypothetical protein SPYSS1447_0451 [Streptococcus pyogenes SS1447]
MLETFLACPKSGYLSDFASLLSIFIKRTKKDESQKGSLSSI